MRDSVLVENQCQCVVCGRDPVQRHHVFYGTANRKKADEYGYWIPLCPYHHRAIHIDHEFDKFWKRTAQEHFEQEHTREQFIEEFIRSEL